MTAHPSSLTIGIREARRLSRAGAGSTASIPGERVIADDLRRVQVPADEAIATLLLKALDGHGFATAGPLAARGVALEQIGMAITTWGEWKAAHPDTTVL